MNKLTKLGVSALCGTLASVTGANAGTMDVTGSATATFVSLSNVETGNPIGMDTGITFKGSGELDGGQTFSVTVAHTDQNAFSAGTLELVTNSLGTWKLDQAGGGGGVGGYDDNVPTAWEETSGTGVTHGADHTKGVGSSTNLQYISPKLLGSQIKLAWAPKNDGKISNDKVTGGASGRKQEGFDVVVDINQDNWNYLPNIFAGYSITDQEGRTTTTVEQEQVDHEEGTVGLKFKIGPIAAGVQKTFEHPGNEDAGETEYYLNTMWGVSFNVNDDLSVSYGDFESKRGFVNPVAQGGGTANRPVTIAADSWQIAYSMGGASLKVAKTKVENSQYVSGAEGDHEGTTLALSLAF